MIKQDYNKECPPIEEDHGDDVECPFCGDGGYDRPGLKWHIKLGKCEIYEALDEV